MTVSNWSEWLLDNGEKVPVFTPKESNTPGKMQHPDNTRHYERADPDGKRVTYASYGSLMINSDDNPIENAKENGLVQAPPSAANLISSQAKPSPNSLDSHYPCIDLDGVNVRLAESSSPPNVHLYIDKPCSWDDYELLLHALYRCGIISRAYLDFSVRAKMTTLRLRPDKHKADTQAFPAIVSNTINGLVLDDGKTDHQIELDNIDKTLEAL